MSAADSVVSATAEIRVAGRRRGSAVRVTDRHLLTAGHVVRGEPVEVVFPAVSAEPQAAVIALQSVQHDFAILDLGPQHGAVSPAPARLAPGRALPPSVAVFGYPEAARDTEGVWRSFDAAGRTTSGMAQLRWRESAGTFVGQSGGPVVDEVSGDLLGILLAGSERGRFDRFLPLDVISREWPELPLPWLFAGDDARNHATRRARGQRSRAQGGDLFRGRLVALDRLSAWLSDDWQGRPLVVTGRPGSGKSAVLCRTVLDAEASCAAHGVFFHARGAPLEDLVEAVGTMLDRSATGIDDLLDAAEASHHKLVVAVDALDEATEPELLASALSELSRLPTIRVVVATRALASASRFAHGSLLHRLLVSGGTSAGLVDLDAAPYRDATALVDFAEALLTQSAATNPAPIDGAWRSYREDAGLSRMLAAAIADRAEDNFLVAAITASTLSTQEQVLDATVDGFEARSLPASVGDALDRYLATLPADHRPATRGVLIALAYARGVGIDDRHWRRFAAALGYATDQATLDAIRDSAAADFLLETFAEGGDRYTRLFHQALVDQLRRGRPDADESLVWESIRQDVQGRGGWPQSDLYERMHGIQHAAAAGALPDLLADLSFVSHADGRLLVSTLHAAPADISPVSTFILHDSQRLAGLGPVGRLALLTVYAAHGQDRELHERLLRATGDTAIRPLWGHLLGAAHQKLLGHSGPVNCVAVGTVDGENIVVSGGSDKTVRVWSAEGVALGEPIDSQEQPPTAVAVVRFAGRDVVLCGHRGLALSVWDGKAMRVLVPPAHPPIGPIHGLGVARDVDGRETLIISTKRDFTARTAEGAIVDRRQIGEGVTAVGDFADGCHVVVSSFYGTRLYRTTGARLAAFDTESGHPARAVTLGRLNGADVVVVARRHLATIFDWRGGGVGRSLIGHTGVIRAVAIGRVGGQDVVISGADDGTMRLWDAAGAPIATVTVGDHGAVRALAIGRLNGRDVIVSGGKDGVVRIWDARAIRNVVPATGAVLAIASGSTAASGIVTVTAGNTVAIWDTDGMLRASIQEKSVPVVRVAAGRWMGRDVVAYTIRDTIRMRLPSGERIDEIKAHVGRVTAIAFGRLGELSVMVSAGSDKVVRVWASDPAPLFTRSIGKRVTAVAIGPWDGRDVVVAAGKDRLIHVFDAIGVEVTVLRRGSAQIKSVAMGRWEGSDVIVAGTADGTTYVWRSPTEPKIVLRGHSASVEAVGLGLLGGEETVVTGGHDARIMFWTAGHDTPRIALTGEGVSGLTIIDGRVVVSDGGALACFAVPPAGAQDDVEIPADIERTLMPADAPVTPRRNDLGSPIDPLLKQARVLLDKALPDEAFDLVFPLAGEPAALPIIAEAAYRSGDHERIRSATAALEGKRSPAHRSRLAGLALTLADFPLADSAARHIAERDVGVAATALVSLLVSDPRREWEAYRSAAGRLSASPLADQLPTLAASRALAIARGLSRNDPRDFPKQRDEVLTWYWTIWRDAQAAVLRETLLAHADDRQTMGVLLLPYQLVSVHEALAWHQPVDEALTQALAARVAATIRAYRGTGNHRQNFIAWTKFSDFAGEVALKL